MPDTAVSEKEWYRKLLLQVCMAVGIIVFIMLFLPLDAVGEAVYYAAMGGVLIGSLLAAGLAWQQRVYMGATLLALMLSLATVLLLFWFPQFRDVLVGGQITIILLVSLFLGKQAATGWAIAHLAILGILYLLETNGLIAAREGNIAAAVIREAAVIIFSALLIRWWIDSAREQTRLLRQGEQRYRTRFAAAPVALLETDCSQAIIRLHFWRDQIGVKDLRSYFRAHPQEAARLAHLVRIQDANDASLKLYEATDKADLTGGLDRIISPESYGRFIEELLRLTAGQYPIDGEMTHKTLGGKRIEAAVTCTPIPGYEETHERIMMTVRDVTAQREMQESLSQHTERIQLQQKIDHAILTAESPPDIAKATLQQLRPLVPFWAATVALFDFERDEFELLAIHSLVPLPLETEKRHAISNISFIFDLAQQPYSLTTELPDVETMNAFAPTMKKYGVEQFLYVPLICQDAYVGLMVLIAQPSRTFTAEQIGIAQEVAHPLAIAIHNANILQSEKIARQQAETLQDVSALLNKEVEVDVVLDTILSRLTELVEADSKAILLLSDASIYIAAYQNMSEALQLLAAEQVDNWQNVQAVIKRREPVIISDTRTDPSWKTLPGMEHVRSWMGIPLLVNGKMIGLFSLDHQKRHFYTDADAKLALAFANHAALVIEKVRLFNQAKAHAAQLEQRVGERTRELRTLYQVTAVTVEHRDLHAILQSGLAQALSALDGYAGAIHLEGESGWQLYVHHGLSASLKRTLTTLPRTHPLFSRIAVDNTPRLFTPNTDPPLPAANGWQDYQTYVGAPMHAGGQVVGIFSVLGQDPLLYTGEEIALIASVADQLGIAVENASLHRQAEDMAVLQERQRLSRELHDSVAQTLYGIKLYGEAMRAQTHNKQWEEADATGELLTKLAQQAMREMRLLLYQLRERDTLQQGLYAALGDRLKLVEERGEIEVDLLQEEIGAIPVEIEQALFWAAQEALNNVIKHSQATAVSVRLLSHPEDHLTLIIEDNGVGFIPNRRSEGMGLDNMQHRVLEVGGTMALATWPGVGAQVHFQVQLQNSAF